MSRLQQVAEKYRDEVLYIGAITGFFFIGRYPQYDEDIDSISIRYLTRARDAYRTATYDYERTRRAYQHGAKYLENILIEKQAFMDTAKKRMEYQEMNYNLRNRKVKSTFLDEDGLRIVVEGEEFGQYWFKEEYDADK